MAHWIRQQIISSCCRGHSTSNGRGWGQDSTPLWLMTAPQQRLPVGKNVTLNWMWRGPTFKLHLTRLQNKKKKKKPLQKPSWLGLMGSDWKAPLAHTKKCHDKNESRWLMGSPDILVLASSFNLFRNKNKHEKLIFSFCFDVFVEAFPWLQRLCNKSSIQNWTAWSFNWNQARAGIKHTTAWAVILLGPIITLLISVWLSRRRDRANLWSLTRWHKAFQTSLRSSAKVISTN